MQRKSKIRPSSRHLFTIGEDLIQDKYAAMVELVKNSYDADASKVNIIFDNSNEGFLKIIIRDNGHGMSSNDIENKWLVPSTPNKQEQKKSPKERIMQGRKGIGRYAANILGEILELETVDINGEKSNVLINWVDFERFKYLDQIEILINSEMTSSPPGTCLTILKDISKESEESDEIWTREDIDALNFELKKLLPPQDNLEDIGFDIVLQTIGYAENVEDEINEKIEIFPIREFYDYRIYGTVTSKGEAKLVYENTKSEKIVEYLNLNYGDTNCGTVTYDIRVFDRDQEGIESLRKSLENTSKNHFVSKLEAKRLLNIVNGIGVYRNGFRIRPLGNPDNDWLKLDSQRVQNPSQKIGGNQVIGYVHIESEEQSGLVEKSARDGLKNDRHYKSLVYLTQQVIGELEDRRFSYRRKHAGNKRDSTTKKQLEELINSQKLSSQIDDILMTTIVSSEDRENIINKIKEDEENKQAIVEELTRTIAMYQGQATLGKIVHIIMHEGRRPLNYFTNQVPNLDGYIRQFLSNPSENISSNIRRIGSNIVTNTKIFNQLFKKLNPLASKRSETKKNFKLVEAIEGSIEIFQEEFQKKEITVELVCDSTIEINGWYEDFVTIFTNLIENSIYWLVESKKLEKEIKIYVIQKDGELQIDFYDSGTGIKKHLIENNDIFSPEFSKKKEGSGLGLPISGEAAERNNFTIVAIENNQGAHFRLTQKIIEEEE